MTWLHDLGFFLKLVFVFHVWKILLFLFNYLFFDVRIKEKNIGICEISTFSIRMGLEINSHVIHFKITFYFLQLSSQIFKIFNAFTMQ